MRERIRATTILCCRRDGVVAMGGDGQVSVGQTVMKHGARKIRTLADGKVLAGIAGGAADGLALLERFESQLKSHGGKLLRAAVELAKDWRTDRKLRHLQALLAVANADTSLLLSGTGDVIEPDDGLIAVGSGGPFALAAARALLAHTDLGARDIVAEGLKIAASICVYTNDQHHILELTVP